MGHVPFWDDAYPIVAKLDPVTGRPTTNTSLAAPGILTTIPENIRSALTGCSIWDIIEFGDRRAPGICRVDGGRRTRIDHRESAGITGEAPSFEGYRPAQFTVTLTLWTAQHLADFADLVAFLQPPPPASSSSDPTSPMAVRVVHPAFAVIGVMTVYVEDIRVPRYIGKQTFEAVIDCVESGLFVAHGAKKIVESSVTRNSDGTMVVQTRLSQTPDPSQTSTGPNGP